MRWPAWVWEIIAEYFPALEAAELRSAIRAAESPHLKSYHRRALHLELAAAMRPLLGDDAEADDEPPMEHIEENPEKAAAWFAEQGYRVVKSG